MRRIIDTTNPNYIAYWKQFHPNGSGAHNGAYYYSKEIVKNIIPNVDTDRNWDTLGMKFCPPSRHSIVFLHNNVNHEKVYRWLRRYEDLVLVCSTESTYEWAKTVDHCHAVFLPLSIDVKYVKKFKTNKTKGSCYAGNLWAFKKPDIEKYVPKGVEFPPKNLPREELLKFIAPFRACYAVGISAIEARCLGCEIKVCDSRFPDPSIWKVIDNSQAARLLQAELDKIDK